MARSERPLDRECCAILPANPPSNDLSDLGSNRCFVFIAFRCAPDDADIGWVFLTLLFVLTAEAVFAFLEIHRKKSHPEKHR
jgi:hypothetical protein